MYELGHHFQSRKPQPLPPYLSLVKAFNADVWIRYIFSMYTYIFMYSNFTHCSIIIGMLLFSSLYQLVLFLETWIIEGIDEAKKVNIWSGLTSYYKELLGQG